MPSVADKFCGICVHEGVISFAFFFLKKKNYFEMERMQLYGRL